MKAWRGLVKSGLTLAAQSFQGPRVTYSIPGLRGVWHLPASDIDVRHGEKRA